MSSSFTVHTTEPTDLDTLFVDQFHAQDCMQIPIKDTSQVSTSSCGLGAIVYQEDTDEVKARMSTGWEVLATSRSIPSSRGQLGTIQLSDGSEGLAGDSHMHVNSSPSTNPISRLNVDASNTPAPYEPNARLRLIPPTTAVTALTAPALDGDLAYFEDSLLSGKDLYFFNGSNWVSLTGAGAPSTAAGPQYSVQINATGATLGGSADFLFDTSVANNVVTLNANSTITGATLLSGDTTITTSGSTTTAQFDTANGVQIQTTATTTGIDLRSQGAAPMLLQTDTGEMELTSASAGIALEATTAGKTITNKTGNIVTELKDDGASGEFLTISSDYTGNSPPDFGIRLRDETTYNQGVGASLYLDGSTGINTPRTGTMELNTLDGSTSLTRVFLQSQIGSSSGASGGGYRILFASGTASSGSAPTPDNLGSNHTLQNGQFYVGEARTGSRPHINYNLSGNTPPGLIGFGNFNFAETRLNICNAAETTLYASLGKGLDNGVLYGGNLSVYPDTGSIPEIQLRGDGLATIGYNLSTDLIRLDGTATGASPGGLITIENSSYQSLGNPLANPIKLDATGANPEILIGTNGTGGPVHGQLRITDGINNSIVADGGANGISTYDGTFTVGGANSNTIILGGRNNSSVGLRSIDADGSLLANGIGHIAYGTWDGQTYDQRADLCLGGTPGVIPDSGQPTGSENNPNFIIRTQVRSGAAETYPSLILNRYLGPASPTVDSRKLQGVMYLNRSTEGGSTEKNRVQLATGDPYSAGVSYMMSLVCKQPSATSSSLLPQGATVSNFPITTPRDPDDGICFNGDIVINRTRGITIDAFDYTGTSWSGAQGPLFIGKVNNLAGLKSNTIASTYTVGVEIGADFGGSTPTGNNNTGCIVNGDIRVGNVTTMNVVHGGTTHTGYVGDGGLLAINETGLRGSSVYTNIIGVGGTKLYMAKNVSRGADDDAYVVCSCVEGPQGMVVLRGQVQLSGHECQIDLDSTTVTTGTMMVPHNNPSFPWPPGTFAAMFQNPTVLVTNAGRWAGTMITPPDAILGATPVINQDPQWTQVRGEIKIDISASPPQSILLLQANIAGNPDLVLNYVVYCERKDVGYTGAAGYPGFAKPYANPITGTVMTFSGAATPDEIKDNGGGDSGVLP
jgi:hypothetical protein